MRRRLQDEYSTARVNRFEPRRTVVGPPRAGPEPRRVSPDGNPTPENRHGEYRSQGDDRGALGDSAERSGTGQSGSRQGSRPQPRRRVEEGHRCRHRQGAVPQRRPMRTKGNATWASHPDTRARKTGRVAGGNRTPRLQLAHPLPRMPILEDFCHIACLCLHRSPWQQSFSSRQRGDGSRTADRSEARARKRAQS
jgi:hypothetical protein